MSHLATDSNSTNEDKQAGPMGNENLITIHLATDPSSTSEDKQVGPMGNENFIIIYLATGSSSTNGDEHVRPMGNENHHDPSCNKILVEQMKTSMQDSWRMKTSP